MKIFNKTTILLITTLSIYGESKYEVFKENFCGDNIYQLKGNVLLTCDKTEYQDILSNKKELEKINFANNAMLIEKFCKETVNGSDEEKVKEYRKNIDINSLPFPVDSCICNIRTKKANKAFCEVSPQDKIEYESRAKELKILSQLRSLDLTENLKQCPDFKPNDLGYDTKSENPSANVLSILDKLKSKYQIDDKYEDKKLFDNLNIISSKFNNAKEVASHQEIKTNSDAESCSNYFFVLHSIANLENEKFNNPTPIDRLLVDFGNLDNVSNYDKVQMCLSEKTEIVSSIKMLDVTAQSLQVRAVRSIASVPEPAETPELPGYEEIKERHEKYQKAQNEAEILNREVEKLSRQIDTASEEDLIKINQRVGEIKTRLKGLEKYGYSYMGDDDKIQDIQKNIYDTATSKKYSNVKSDYKPRQVYTYSPGSSKTSNQKITSGNYKYKSSSSKSANTSNFKKEYDPNLKPTSFLPPSSGSKEAEVKDLQEQRAFQVANSLNELFPNNKRPKDRTQNINKNSGPKENGQSSSFASNNQPMGENSKSNSSNARSSSRAPASVGAGSFSGSSSGSSAASSTSPSLESYEVPTEKDVNNVLENKRLPNIKIVFVEDIKILKLFKFDKDTYKLKEELSKEEFIENYDSLPSEVKEQGKSFFNIKSASDLFINR